MFPPPSFSHSQYPLLALSFGMAFSTVAFGLCLSHLSLRRPEETPYSAKIWSEVNKVNSVFQEKKYGSLVNRKSRGREPGRYRSGLRQ
jgi:hypothetical protein